MCLAIPGRVIRIEENPTEMTMGTVDFAGVRKDICLAYVPEVKLDDYVLVHASFAITIVDEKEANETLALLRQMGELSESDNS